jgi:protein tyrosine phosphatase (PTP) superfamily phosphohydrolase (DUF442 family)
MALRLLLCGLLLTGCRAAGRNIAPLHNPPPEHWSQRVEDEEFDGLVVFRRTDHLYHSGQPSPEQFKTLQQRLGIRTVVNVRRTHSEEKVVETLGMKYVWIPIPAWSLKQEHAVEFLKVMRDPSNHPVLVYCWYGGDRSNTLSAIYRVAVQGWSKEEAIREMTEGGNYFHPFWQNLVWTVREMDVQRVRLLAGYGAPDQVEPESSHVSDSRMETRSR